MDKVVKSFSILKFEKMTFFHCFRPFLVIFWRFSAHSGQLWAFMKIDPCEVERWLTPFCSSNNQSFSFKKYERNLRQKLWPPTPLNTLSAFCDLTSLHQNGFIFKSAATPKKFFHVFGFSKVARIYIYIYIYKQIGM